MIDLKDAVLELRLMAVKCLANNEADGDEIYLLFQVRTGRSRKAAQERVPKNLEFWKMKAGDEETPDHLLYIDKFTDGLTCTFSLMEMDMVKMMNDSISIVGKMVDDFIGRFTLRVSSAGKLAWEAGRKGKLEPKAPNGDILFRLTGNRSDYMVRLRAKIS